VSSTSANRERKASVAVSDDDTRARILDAALRLLTDEGHAALTVRRVAAEAGCSTIGVYTWFGGKDGLIDAIWTEGFASFAAALRRAKPIDAPLGRLQSQALAYRRWALRHPRHYRVMFLNAVVDHEPSDEAMGVSLAAFAELQSAVAEASRHGELRSTDLDAVAMAMWGTVHGLVSIELANSGPPKINTKKLADRAYDVAIAAIVTGFVRP
jgi:AcrR family transcriptional regulator